MSALVALVDPIRTSTSLVEELSRRGIALLRVESGACGPLAGEGVVRAPTLDAMAAELRRRRVTRVLGCVDPSLPYADQLNALLGLPSHGMRRSEARRDKYQMNEVIRAAGLSAPWHFQTSSPDVLRARLAEVIWPVVVKPAASGGTDNVHLCHDLGQASAAFERILHAKNLMGGVNHTVLVQEYVDGIEYVVDCVSYDGLHVPIGFFRYHKGTHNGRAFIYEKERFLRFEDPISQRLLRYATEALDALEVRTGASHMELKIDGRDQIRFIELGARLSGGDTAKLVCDLREDGKSQVEYWIDAALGEEPPEAAYRTARDGVRVYVISHGEGVLTRWLHLDRIRALPSFVRMNLHAEVGRRVGLTTDLSNDAGWIDLANADPDALRRDEATLDAILADGVMELA